jgi:oligopeptide transport system ATP-binding protein
MLKVEDLRVHFPVRSGVFMKQTGAVKAVDGVSLELCVGETLGLVGESGCGKSTLGKALVRLLRPTSGSIFHEGQEITHLSQHALRPLRREFQMIFQDPAESLDGRMNVRSLVEECCGSVSVRVFGRTAAADRDSEGVGVEAEVAGV